MFNLENVIDYDDNTIQEEQSQMLHTTWEEATYISFDEDNNNPGFWLVLTLPITMIGYLHNQTTNFYRRYYYD